MTSNPAAGKRTKAKVVGAGQPAEEGFEAIVQLVDAARGRAYAQPHGESSADGEIRGAVARQGAAAAKMHEFWWRGRKAGD